MHQKSVLSLRLPRAVSPETAADVENDEEEKVAEAASQGMSEADALKTGGEEEFPIARLSTATLSPNSALRRPTGLRHP